jgi:ubiquinone/menaquinone biosynthesis C-methylase UbiE
MNKFAEQNEEILNDFYEHADKYLEKLGTHRDKHFRKYFLFLDKFVSKSKPLKILESGCGDGFSSYMIAKRFTNSEVVGTDLSNLFIGAAKKQFKLPNLKFMQKNATKTGFSKETFDVICSNDVIEHIPDVEAYFNECMRILKPGGRLIVLTPNMMNPLVFTIDMLTGTVRQPFVKKWKDNFKMISYTLKKTIQKLSSNKPNFTYRKLKSLDKNVAGGDGDAVYITSLVDFVKKFSDKNKYKIISKNLVLNSRDAIISFFLGTFYTIGFVVKKKK